MQAPPSDIPRIFVGSITPAVTDSALESLMARFGEVVAIVRNRERNFAHVSLRPKSSADLERCLSSLNGTKWFGSTLRVQIAKEHFIWRLQREWTEETSSVAMPSSQLPVLDEHSPARKHAELEEGNSKRTESTNSDEATEKSDVDKTNSIQNLSKRANSFSWKGKHVSFPDISSNDSHAPPFSSGVQSKGVNRVIIDQQSAPVLNDVSVRNGVGPSKLGSNDSSFQGPSAPAAAAMDLFGLSVNNPQSESENVDLNGKGPTDDDVKVANGSQEKSTDNSGSRQVAKRRRLSETTSAEQDLDDSKTVDVTHEKNVAMTVLARMFPGSLPHTSDDQHEDKRQSIDMIVEKCKRLGLYRRLQQGDNSSGLDEKDICGADKKHDSFEKKRPPISHSHCESKPPRASFRKAGLYRQLVHVSYDDSAK